MRHAAPDPDEPDRRCYLCGAAPARLYAAGWRCAGCVAEGQRRRLAAELAVMRLT